MPARQFDRPTLAREFDQHFTGVSQTHIGDFVPACLFGITAEKDLDSGEHAVLIQPDLRMCWVKTQQSQMKPEIVLLDIGLPDIDGYEVARKIRLSSGGLTVKLIALTGWGQPEDKKQAADAGFDEHVTKPVAIDQLRGLVAIRRD